jgi:hypothetical protein
MVSGSYQVAQRMYCEPYHQYLINAYTMIPT